MHPHTLRKFLQSLHTGAVVLNFGSYDDSLHRLSRALKCDLSIDCADVQPPNGHTENFILLEKHSVTLPIADDRYDAIIASHVIEHLHTPIETMAEWLRVLKPGGMLYIEAPSDRAANCRSHPDYMK